MQFILNIELLDSKYVHARYGRGCEDGKVCRLLVLEWGFHGFCLQRCECDEGTVLKLVARECEEHEKKSRIRDKRGDCQIRVRS